MGLDPSASIGRVGREEVKIEKGGSGGSHTAAIYSVRWAGAGTGGWSGVRETYCWLAGGWKLVLERCERKTLLDWRLLELRNRVIINYRAAVHKKK